MKFALGCLIEKKLRCRLLFSLQLPSNVSEIKEKLSRNGKVVTKFPPEDMHKTFRPFYHGVVEKNREIFPRKKV